MGRLLSGTAPLRGRAGLDLLVQPFDFRQAVGFWGLQDRAELAFRVHAIVGGTPAYRDLLRGDAPSSGRGFDAWVPEDIRIVERQPDALRQRRPTYRIAEPIVRFYFAVMRGHLPRLERGAGARVWRDDARASFSSQVLGPHFEDLARRWTATYTSERTLGGSPSVVGSTVVRDASGRTSHEVDVVALASSEGGGPRRILALGEAKWGTDPMPVGELERLLEIRGLLEARDDLRFKGARLLLFSPAGFAERLRHRASEDRSIVLVDLQRMYAGE